MNEVLYTKTFSEWQQELDTELVRSAESFVKIGYLLKVARDTDILANTGYANVVEFAKARYGLDADSFPLGGSLYSPRSIAAT